MSTLKVLHRLFQFSEVAKFAHPFVCPDISKFQSSSLSKSSIPIICIPFPAYLHPTAPSFPISPAHSLLNLNALNTNSLHHSPACTSPILAPVAPFSKSKHTSDATFSMHTTSSHHKWMRDRIPDVTQTPQTLRNGRLPPSNRGQRKRRPGESSRKRKTVDSASSSRRKARRSGTSSLATCPVAQVASAATATTTTLSPGSSTASGQQAKMSSCAKSTTNWGPNGHESLTFSSAEVQTASRTAGTTSSVGTARNTNQNKRTSRDACLPLCGKD